MKKNFRFILDSINAILKEVVNFDFKIDMLSCNLDKKEYFKRIIEASSYEEDVKKIIEDNGYEEKLFYYELTAFFNSRVPCGEYKVAIDDYNNIVSDDAKFVFLLFVSKSLREDKSFWMNIVKQNSSLRSVFPFIPDTIKQNMYFKMICARHALDVGEEPYNIPALYGDVALRNSVVAVSFIDGVYNELEYKQEVFSSISKVETADFLYESYYGRYIRSNIDYLMTLSDFRSKLVGINERFITLIPKEYVTEEMIARVRENVCGKAFFCEDDFLFLEYLDKISTNLMEDAKKLEKK